MHKTQLKELVEVTLNEFSKAIRKQVNSTHAINLVCATIAQESAMGYYIRQINGPALGICQIEPSTFEDIIQNYLEYNPEVKRAVMNVCNVQRLTATTLMYNNKLSILMCRIVYMRRLEPLPTTIEGYAKYWKQFYNTPKGKGTEPEFIENYKKYVL